IVVRSCPDVTAFFRFSQFTHEPSAGERGIDFECGAKNHVFERQPWSAEFCFRFRYSSAEIAQENLKLILLLGLSCVISWPILRVGLALLSSDGHSLSNGCGTIGVLLLDNGVGHCKNVLTGAIAQFKIRAITLWIFASKINSVESSPALGRHCPDFSRAGFLHNSQCRDCFTAFFSNVHDSLLEVGAGLGDNESAPCIVVNPAMFGLALPTVATGSRALKTWGEGWASNPFSPAFQAGADASSASLHRNRGIHGFASLNAPNSISKRDGKWVVLRPPPSYLVFFVLYLFDIYLYGHA